MLTCQKKLWAKILALLKILNRANILNNVKLYVNLMVKLNGDIVYCMDNLTM